MFRTDTGNFNRFLTSLGLLLLAASLVIPYFYFRNAEVLEIPARDLERMTETGRDALTGRQDAIVSLEPWVLTVAVLAALLGIVLLVLGGLRLRSAQASDDEEAEIRVRHARIELEKKDLTSDEQAARLAARAEDDQAIEESRPAATQKSDRLEAIARIVRAVENEFALRGIGTHRMKSQIRIRSTKGSIDVDGLFESLSDRYEDVLLETKVVLSVQSLPRIGRNFAADFVGHLARYQMITEGHATGWLVVVVSSESEAELTPALVRRTTATLRHELGELGRVTLIGESEIDSLPAVFTREFGTA